MADDKSVKVASEPGKSDPPRQGSKKVRATLTQPDSLPGITSVGTGDRAIPFGVEVELTQDRYDELKQRGFIREEAPKAEPKKADDDAPKPNDPDKKGNS